MQNENKKLLTSNIESYYIYLYKSFGDKSQIGAADRYAALTLFFLTFVGIVALLIARCAPSLVWQECLIILVNLLFIVLFFRGLFLYYKNEVSMTLLLGIAFTLALTSFFFVRFACTGYHIHGGRCSCPHAMIVRFLSTKTNE